MKDNDRHPDALAEAIENLTAAGLDFVEVARCPDPACSACGSGTVPVAA